jgi:hypothetical protein
MLLTPEHFLRQEACMDSALPGSGGMPPMLMDWSAAERVAEKRTRRGAA